jgi:hypothetical protein
MIASRRGTTILWEPSSPIDIRTKTLFQIGSERLAAGISMIADMAGCRWPEFR